jgi:NTP pyrophosphatase (non-canonical NTP hydrolase)
MNEQLIKYKKALQEKEAELLELREEAGELLAKFIQYSNLAENGIRNLKKENARLKNKLKKAGL